MDAEKEKRFKATIKANKATPHVLKYMWLLYGLNKKQALDLFVTRALEGNTNTMRLGMTFTYWFCWQNTPEGDVYWRHIEHLHRLPEGMLPLNEPV